jgi:hypothetical protein
MRDDNCALLHVLALTSGAVFTSGRWLMRFPKTTGRKLVAHVETRAIGATVAGVSQMSSGITIGHVSEDDVLRQEWHVSLGIAIQATHPLHDGLLT